MTDHLRLVLSWKLCSASKNLRHAGTGHSHHPNYKSSLDFIWAEAHNALVGVDWPTDGEYMVHLELVPPDLRRRDYHNYIGVVMDGLEAKGTVFENDSLVVQGSWVRVGPNPDNPRIIVTVEALPPEPDPGADGDDDAGQDVD